MGFLNLMRYLAWFANQANKLSGDNLTITSLIELLNHNLAYNNFLTRDMHRQMQTELYEQYDGKPLRDIDFGAIVEEYGFVLNSFLEEKMNEFRTWNGYTLP